MSDIKPVKVLFVCMGNICRSPTAHGVFQALVDEHGLGGSIQVDSAGTHSYHTGNPPDPRSQATARKRGLDLSGLRARRFESNDFIDFDYLLAMDKANLADMLAIRPDDAIASADLMLKYSDRYQEPEIPDPYFGNDGFELVFDMIEDASHGLLRQIRSRYDL
ncbi:MAG: low molecular weight phosphotyrosine protein phosphatase [Gammaproteobacteria bacterium]|nr:low molecular weight phosphotyrosine protein phosphatase [Gammaproteobacteria bacterium]MDH3447476.1 low molecular weight phosphotyrosine protein phosphatase [Gammaproteobacteria bacterium]